MGKLISQIKFSALLNCMEMEVVDSNFGQMSPPIALFSV